MAAPVTVLSGSTITFTTGGTVPKYNIDAGADVNGVVENGAAKLVFANGLDIQAGATVTFGTASTPANRPLHIVATTGNITINAAINGSGGDAITRTGSGISTGYAGAAGPGGYAGSSCNGSGARIAPNPAGPGTGGDGVGTVNPLNDRAAGGAGYGGVGGMNSNNYWLTYVSSPPTTAGLTAGVGGVVYGGAQNYILQGGSGGGSGKGSSGGGGGGGAIALTAMATGANITIGATGSILVNGGTGSFPTNGVNEYRYGGGGGSGGAIRIDAGAGTVTVNGTLSAKGGHGANSLWMSNTSSRSDTTTYNAGGGAGGRIAIYTSGGTYGGTGTLSVAGGAGGTIAGSYFSYANTPPGGDLATNPIPGTYLIQDGQAGFVGTIATNYVGHVPSQAGISSPVIDATNISVFTALTWTPAPTGATSQTVYFGTALPLTTVVLSDPIGTATTVSNAALGGPLADNTTYYWQVATNGNLGAAAVWDFTTGFATPNTPTPADNAFEAPYSASAALIWLADVAGTTNGADVYFGTSQSAVEGRSPATKYVVGSPYTTVAVSAPDKGVRYYWMVDQKYPGSVVKTRNVAWTFRTVSRKLNLKTGSLTPGATAWYNIDGAGDVAAVIDDANTARFSFPTFSYDSTWDVNVTGKRPATIWSDGGIIFNGRLIIDGGIALNTSHKGGEGVSGGYNGGGDNATTYADFPYPATVQMNGPGHGNSSTITLATDTSKTYVDGSGAGYGGPGGSCARYSGGFGGPGGLTYGQQELYKLWGGSGGGGGGTGRSTGGGGGGGAVEFYAKSGNIAIGANAVISANGGTIDPADPSVTGTPPLDFVQYPGGGGSGGSVRLIASGNVSVATGGSVTANGAHGGDRSLADPCDTGGGGGGGRIAVYAGGTYTNTGTVTASGAREGQDLSGNGYGNAGKDGTIFAGKVANLLQTHGISPADKYMAVHGAVNDPNFQVLSWYPALGSTTNTVYMGTSQASLTLKNTYTDPLGMTGQKVYNTGALLANQKYYWRVDYQYGVNPVVTGPVYTFGTGTFTGAVTGDMNGDLKVTFVDFALFASQWRVCNLYPTTDCN
jgi:hypothetical protein